MQQHTPFMLTREADPIYTDWKSLTFPMRFQDDWILKTAPALELEFLELLEGQLPEHVASSLWLQNLRLRR
jgi:hypothetical protein